MRRLTRLLVPCLGFALLLSLSGCQEATTESSGQKAALQPEPLTISEGDTLKISFPGAPKLDSTQQVRRDGRISLDLVGEVVAAGKTPVDLENDLAKLVASQVVSNQVTVTVVSSSFAVYVTGSVLKPGKLEPDRPLTALEAIMEAGGFVSDKANSSAVVIIRNQDGVTKNFTLNIKAILDGTSNNSFYLKPNDIIYVPEKFTWF